MHSILLDTDIEILEALRSNLFQELTNEFESSEYVDRAAGTGLALLTGCLSSALGVLWSAFRS